MTLDTVNSAAEEKPRVKTDWAAIRAQNEAAFQVGMDRVAAAYTEQREAPWRKWAEEAKADMNGLAAMRQVAKQLINHGAAETHAKHLAGLVLMTPVRRHFSEVAYNAPATATAVPAFAASYKDDFEPQVKYRSQASQSMVRH